MVLYFGILRNTRAVSYRVIKKLEVTCQDQQEGWRKAMEYQRMNKIQGSLFSGSKKCIEEMNK